MAFALKPQILTESQIELLICHYLSFEKVFFWKSVSTGYFDTASKRFRRQHNPYAINGVSDLLLVIEGKLYCWELKTARGAQSASQKLFEERLQKEGGAQYRVIRSLEEARAELERIRKKPD